MLIIYTVCEGDTVFDERNLDGPNWSLGMTQIGGELDVSQDLGTIEH